MHPQLILDALAGVAGEPHRAGGVVGVHRLDEADGADGDEIVLLIRRCVVLFCHVRHQTQVVADEFVPRGPVAQRHRRKGGLLLGGGERPGKAAAFQMQRQIQHVPRRRLQKNAEDAKHIPTSRYSLCAGPVFLS